MFRTDKNLSLHEENVQEVIISLLLITFLLISKKNEVLDTAY